MLNKEVLKLAWNSSSDALSWNLINHFKKHEFKEHTKEISGALVLSINEYRKQLRKAVYISPANWGEHSKYSWHYVLKERNDYAQALDIFPKCKLSYAWLAAIKSNLFNGIGIYPHWKDSTKKIDGGLHLDIRKFHRIVMWWCDINGKYHYFTNWKQVHTLFSVLLDLDN